MQTVTPNIEEDRAALEAGIARLTRLRDDLFTEPLVMDDEVNAVERDITALRERLDRAGPARD
jgi:predicted  nucleic acid-binding Zn-ribbon protein